MVFSVIHFSGSMDEGAERDLFDLRRGGREFLVAAVADPRFEGSEDIVLVQPLDGDDEGKAEFFDIGGVEFGEAGMLFGAQPVETGATPAPFCCPRSVRRRSPAARQDRDGR